MKDKYMKNGVFSLEYDKETLKDMVLELQEGMIIWTKKRTILGITKATLPLKYYDYYCTKIIGNYFDYEIVEKVESDK